MKDLFKLDTSVQSIAAGAAIGAAAGFAFGKGWKDSAICGAIVAVLLPTGQNIVAKVMPK
jgi:hypothetical protein